MTRDELVEYAIKFFRHRLRDPVLPYGERQAINIAIAALREQPRWTSVEERLPEDERPVLAYYGFDNCGDGDLGMMFVGTLSYYCFDPDPHWQHASMRLVVTHWMPLPEPPTEEEV